MSKDPRTPARHGNTSPRPASPGPGGKASSRAEIGREEPAPIIVDSASELQDIERYILSPSRDQAVVALAADAASPIQPNHTRAILGPGPRIYVITQETLLDMQSLSGLLAPQCGSSARIWQPGLSTDSDLEDHPLVRPLEGEDPVEVLAREFELSRPRVRREIRRLQAANEFLAAQEADAGGPIGVGDLQRAGGHDGSRDGRTGLSDD